MLYRVLPSGQSVTAAMCDVLCSSAAFLVMLAARAAGGASLERARRRTIITPGKLEGFPSKTTKALQIFPS